MKTITPDIKALYDATLIKRAVPVPVHFHYRKWLRYYLDFCSKYHQPRDSRRSLAPFIEKLKAKNQSEQQRKQAADAVSIYFQLKNTGSEGDSVRVLKYAETEISIKKETLKPTYADWRPVYDGLVSEIKLKMGHNKGDLQVIQ